MKASQTERTIYITEAGKTQLEDSEGWWKHMEYRNKPSQKFNYELLLRDEENGAIETALQNGKFNPSFFEPDTLCELIRKVENGTGRIV